MWWIRASGLAASKPYVKPNLWIARALGGLTIACISPLLGPFTSAAIAQTRSVESDRFVDIRNPEQVPTARYGRGESVDLSLIIEEWRDRFPATPVFVCTCRNLACGDTSVWPFREFELYQPFVALGATNAIQNESTGFKCFDIETGRTPRRRR